MGLFFIFVQMEVGGGFVFSFQFVISVLESCVKMNLDAAFLWRVIKRAALIATLKMVSIRPSGFIDSISRFWIHLAHFMDPFFGV